MSDSEETAYISQEEAANVLSGQIEIYQHIQDQALSVVRILLAFIGVAIAALSIFIAEYGLSVENPFLHSVDRFSSPYEIFAFYIALAGTLVGLVRAIRQMHRSLKGAVSLLSAPDLKPFSIKQVDINIIETPNIGGDQYKGWIEHNQELINSQNRDLSDIYFKMRWMAFDISYAIPLGLAIYFVPDLVFTLVSLMLSFGVLKLLVRSSQFGRLLSNLENRKYVTEGMVDVAYILLWYALAILVSWLTHLLS
ncbi:hypothetical protein [Saliphagus infecundisoli]|uniref:Uncharacterized protein n=1 Tax=Saliphagus infecundisoli TaxID=1849069 RepID=A0ABD5QKC8_9EURY|nr:hypothetical protein [Saliphagus infecundisoli]